MPGYDRSGPNGGGSMTGWGSGYCNAGPDRGFSGNIGFGRMVGRGFGFRRGSRGSGRFLSGPYPRNSANELDVLKEQADSLKDALQMIQKRMEELEKSE